MKIKIIDLLNRIAKGEKPKKIKYYDDVYEFDCYEGEWGYVNKEYCRYKWFAKEIDCDLQEQLNDEVELIEEDKKIEMLELSNATINEQEIEFKINEIIEVLNERDI